MPRFLAGSRLFAASGLLAVALLAAACGGGSSTATAPPTSAAGDAGTATTADSALVAYDDCLTQHGVDPSTLAGGGGFGGGGFANGSRPPGASAPNGSRTGSRPANLGSIPGGAANANGSRAPRGTLDPAEQAARDACQSLLPQGGARNSATAQAFQLYLSCLADNGVPVSTAPPSSQAPGSAPASVGGGGPGGFGLGGIDRNSPAFAAADQKCRVLLPAGTQVPGDTRGAADAGVPTSTPTTSR